MWKKRISFFRHYNALFETIKAVSAKGIVNLSVIFACLESKRITNICLETHATNNQYMFRNPCNE